MRAIIRLVFSYGFAFLNCLNFVSGSCVGLLETTDCLVS